MLVIFYRQEITQKVSDTYTCESFVVVAKWAAFSAAKIKQDVSVHINDVTSLGLVEVDEGVDVGGVCVSIGISLHSI